MNPNSRMAPGPGSNNAQLEKDLLELPELVSSALVKWRMATLLREKEEALLSIKLKGGDVKLTAMEVKSFLNSNDLIYALKVSEIKAEANYNFVYERLMSSKKLASLRTAF